MTYRTAVLALALVACGDNLAGSAPDPGPPIPDACNPLGGAGCLLPWPSMSYVKADRSTVSGYRLDLPLAAMPVNAFKVAIDPTPLNARWDGFSPTAPLLAMFPHGVSADGLPGFASPDASLAADSPIVLLDLDTGERAPFFAEVDQNEFNAVDQALIIRPLVRLHAHSHYAVAIRNTVKSADGSALPISPGFAALRDGQPFDHPRFADLAARAPAMFDKLAAAGVPKSELVLAWDFVTASDEMLRADMTAMRNDALATIGDQGAGLVTAAGSDPVFVATAQPDSPAGSKRYLGTFKSPNFLTDGELDDSVIRRDAAGRPQLDGLRDAHFAAIVPACALDGSQPLPRPTIIFGHGLFGSSAGYIDDAFTLSLAETHCLIILAGDFIGLTDRQLSTAATAVTDLNRGPTITEKLGQSVIDFMTLEALTRGPIARAPAFAVEGTPVIDPAQVFYVGGSLGGIMGNMLMAYDPNLLRGVLTVPGGAWSMLLERSFAWGLLKPVLQSSYDDDVYALNVSMFGMVFEPFDPITTAGHVIADPLFGQPAKNILMWYSMGDCLVSNLTTELIARTMAIPMLGPTVKPAWGVDVATGAQPNGIVVFNDHPAPLPPETNVPPADDNGTHAGINRKPVALRMVEDFLLGPRHAANGCALPASPDVAAPCDCATGACD